MTELFIDFETKSEVDITKAGSWVYACDPSTDILVLKYAFGDEEVIRWVPGMDVPKRLAEHILLGKKVVAHNLFGFEFLIWSEILSPKYNFPMLDGVQCYCTMALCYAMNLPGSLDKAAPALGIEIAKDQKGHRVMLQLSQPKDYVDGQAVWYEPFEYPEKFKQLYDYCAQDVRVEREIYKRVLPLHDKERKLFLLDAKINSRGIKIDVEAVKVAADLIELEKEKYNNRIKKLTKHFVSSFSEVKRIGEWLEAHGVKTESIAKADVVELLERDDLPEVCREVLTLRQEAAKSSTAKLAKMALGAGKDSRARGLLQYHAAGTGRWGGRLLQPQNFPRPKISQEVIEAVFGIFRQVTDKKISLEKASETIECLYGPPMEILSDCLRGFLISGDGKDFIACDFSAIEARVLAWLAGQESVLEIFRKKGDIYKHQAAAIYGVLVQAVTKAQRLVGKVCILALGYQGGKGSFHTMGKAYGIKVSDAEAEHFKIQWRNNNGEIVSYWYQVEEAALNAVKYPGQKFSAGAKGRQVSYKTAGSFLFCLLPSGRTICYPYPKTEYVDTPWGSKKEAVTYMAVDSYTKKWSRHIGYGGLFVENITQAVARDVMAESMIRLEEANYPIAVTIHDEIVVEVDEGFGSVEQMEKITSVVPNWAKDLPIDSEGWRGKRYRK